MNKHNDDNQDGKDNNMERDNKSNNSHTAVMGAKAEGHFCIRVEQPANARNQPTTTIAVESLASGTSSDSETSSELGTTSDSGGATQRPGIEGGEGSAGADLVKGTNTVSSQVKEGSGSGKGPTGNRGRGNPKPKMRSSRMFEMMQDQNMAQIRAKVTRAIVSDRVVVLPQQQQRKELCAPSLCPSTMRHSADVSHQCIYFLG
jgi:hypothetical protein